MKRAEVKALFEGMDGDFSGIIDKILDMNGADINGLKSDNANLRAANEGLTNELTTLKAIPNNSEELTKQVNELTQTNEQLKNQIADRDYNDAVHKAIADNGIRFSSKAAERDFMAQLKSKGLAVSDGSITGFDDFYKAQLEADKAAFVTENPPKVRFLGSAGNGGENPDNLAVQAAAKFNAKFNKGSEKK